MTQLKSNEIISYKSVPISNAYMFTTPRELHTIEQVQPLLDVLDEAVEGDLVQVNVFCYGGSISLAKTVVNSIMESKATVTTVNKGVAYSAGGFILLAGDYIEVKPFSNLMIHSSHCSYGHNTEQEIYTQVDFHREELKQFYEFIYKDFLSPEEINTVLSGTPIWLDHSEQESRLDTLFEKREKEYQDILEKNKAPSKESLKKKTKDELVDLILKNNMQNN